MVDDELRRLERRWHETGAEDDRKAWHEALVRHGKRPPDLEKVALVFDEDEHTWADGRRVAFDSPGREGPIGTGLFFVGPKGRALIRRHCYAYEKDGAWGQYPVGCQAELFRTLEGYVVRYGPYGFMAPANTWKDFYMSRDGGETWVRVRAPDFDRASLDDRKCLIRVERLGSEGPEVS